MTLGRTPIVVAESCRSRAESVHLLKPRFTMGKELKEFQLCDFRRLRKKAQDAQDAVLNFLSFQFSRADKAFETFDFFEVFSLPCNLQDETLF